MKTPLLTAALANNPLAKKFEEAVSTLERAATEKSIYNVEYDTAKEWINRSLEEALKPVYNTFLEGHRAQIQESWRDGVTDHLSSYCGMHQVSGRLNNLSKKKYARYGGSLQPFIDLYNEMLPICALYKSLKQYVVMGRKPNPNRVPDEISLKGTGTCSVCYNLQKLDANDKLVHHGFRITDGVGHPLGERVGTCYGVGFQPYEFSSLGCTAFLDNVLRPDLQRNEEHLGKLQRGEIKQFTVSIRKSRISETEFVTYRESDSDPHHYQACLARDIQNTESQIRQLKFSIELYETRVSEWTKKELPYGR